MLSANPLSHKLTATAFVLAMIATFGLHLRAQDVPAVHVGDTKITGLPTDWSHRHVIYGNPGTEADAIKNGTHEQWQRIVNDPRYVVQNLKKSQQVQGPAQQDVEMRQRIADQEFRMRGPRDGRNLRHEKPDPASVELHRDWSMNTGGSASSLVLTIPTATSSITTFTINAPGATAITASAPASASMTGTFTGNPTNGQTVTVGSQQLIASDSTPATASISVAATGLCFQHNSGIKINNTTVYTTANPGTATVTGNNSGPPATGTSVSIGGVTYTFETTISASTGPANQVLIGAGPSGQTNARATMQNLSVAINNTGACGYPTGGPCTAQIAGTNPDVSSAYSAGGGGTPPSDALTALCANNAAVTTNTSTTNATVTNLSAGTAGAQSTVNGTFSLGANGATSNTTIASNIASIINNNTTLNAAFSSSYTTGSNVVPISVNTWGTAGNSDTLALSGTVTGVTFTSPSFSGGTDGTNTGTSFRVDNVVADNASNLAAAIGRNSATTLATAASASGVVTVTASTPGTGGNSVALADGLSNFTWAGNATTLANGNNGTSSGTQFTYWSGSGYDTAQQLATSLASSINASAANGNVTATANTPTNGQLSLVADGAGANTNNYSVSTTSFFPGGNFTGGAGGGYPGVYPAKWALSSEAAVNCTGDYIVYPTGIAGSASSATIVAYNNMYSSCGGTVPTIFWSYNTGGGKVVTSPVISYYGDKVAFIETQSTGAAVLRLLQFASGSGTDYSAPVSPTGSFTNTTVGAGGNTAWSGCTGSCMISVAFQTDTNTDTNSSPFYDATSDSIYVGDDAGVLHKFTGVFLGTPAEVTTGGWPLSLGGKLTSPVIDPITGSVFVGSASGFLYRVSTPQATPASARSNQIAAGTGIVDSPIVDTTSATASVVYVFVGDDNTTGGSGGPRSAVYQFANNFAGATSGLKVSMGGGSGNAALTVYDGDFDNAHYGGATGNLYFCGGTSGTPANPTLYTIGLNATFNFSSVTTAEGLTNGAATCSPATEFYNTGSGASTTLVASTTQTTVATTTLNQVFATGISATTSPIELSSNTNVAVGDYLKIDIEDLLIIGTGNVLGITYWDVNRGVLGTGGAAHTNGATVTVFTEGLGPGSGTITVASGTGFANGDYIQVESEIMLITGGGGTTTLTVTRGALGTTATNHLNGTPVTVAALDWLFLGVTANGSDGACPGACIYSFYIGNPLGNGATAAAGFKAAGGTTGIVIDNAFTSTGASQIYYSTLSGQTCNGAGSEGHGAGICAVQLSQEGLN